MRVNFPGQMTRTRMVLQSAGEGGRPCPSQLSQTRSCPIRPCYSWRLGDWSPCRVEVLIRPFRWTNSLYTSWTLRWEININIEMSLSLSLSLQGADCGEGVSRREMSCVVHWGSLSGPPQPVPVEDQWCVVHSQSKISEIELQQPCTIPCPGLHL